MDERENTEGLARAAAGVATAYTWLFADVLLFLALAVCALAYKDFDEPMRLSTRVLAVGFVAYLWVSSLHILAYMRRAGSGGKMLPWYVSYGFFALKLCIIALAAWWLLRKGAL